MDVYNYHHYRDTGKCQRLQRADGDNVKEIVLDGGSSLYNTSKLIFDLIRFSGSWGCL